MEADEIYGGRVSSGWTRTATWWTTRCTIFPYYVNLMAFFRKMGIDGNLS